MISAQSHRPPLNGNSNLKYLFLILLFSWGCSSTKKAVIVKNPNKEIKPAPPKPDANPPVKMDTIVSKESKPIDPKPPLDPQVPLPKEQPVEKPINPEAQEVARPFETKDIKKFKLLLFAPFTFESTDSSSNNEALRFIQFYAGMQMAIQEYEKQGGLPLHVEVVDEHSKTKVEEVLHQVQFDKPNCIIGPYEIESLKYTVEWAKKNKSLAISPWISSSSIATENPYYLQIKAGLNTHFQIMGEHIRKHFADDQVYIISKTKEDSRTKHFIRESGTNYKEIVISEEDLLSESPMLLEEYFLKDRPIVFVLPLTLSKDENYIYHFLRRVAAEKLDRDVIIYGTYRWLDFKPEILDYINSLTVRICLSNILDIEHPALRSFKLKYFEKYRELPRNDVFEGYDLMKFILFTINKYNSVKASFPLIEEPKYFQTHFNLEPISKDHTQNKIDYFENKYARIVEMHGYKFKILD
ncbi:MAG: hypothetical protein IPM92_07370 [Saprospiraceae bacterium]|nr:hypothetical protein [Saprospiraceae bacterium]